MAIIKCKMCGGDMVLSADQTFGTCEYCGSTMTLPKVDDDQRAAAFNRGNHFRRLGEFDKALTVYERLIQEDEGDAEAHWCCALCRFGIEYVQDPASGAYLPTCHRASFDSFLEDVDYQAALAHADPIARRQYEQDGEQIAQVQRGILSTVQKEAPFDVFICYKESDEAGRRTVDSTLAQEIYYQLTEQGRRVFFARITLEDKAGQEYEPYIFAALHSAKVMVVVGTKPEHLNAVWVKNEWSRYLALLKTDRKRLLIPCYRDMDPYDLPEQLSVLQSYDMSKIGFMQDLTRGINKVLDADKQPEPVKETVVVQGEGGGNLAALLKRGNMALEDREWEKADGFFEQVLNLDAECAEAYFGKALAAGRCANGEELARRLLNIEAETEVLEACPEDRARLDAAVRENLVPGYLDARFRFSDFSRTYPSQAAFWRRALETAEAYFQRDKLMGRAARYARGNTQKILQGIAEKVRQALQKRIQDAEEQDRQSIAKIKTDYAAYLAQMEQRAAELREKAEQKRERDYTAACEAMDSAKTIQAFQEACAKLNALADFRDSAERKAQCEKRIEQMKKKQAAKTKIIALITSATIVCVIAAMYLLTVVIIPGRKYRAAEALLDAGKYKEASVAFAALDDYKDASDRALQARYEYAEALLGAGKYGEASAAFAALDDYKDANDRVLQARYEYAEALLGAGKYEEASAAFAALGIHKDAAERSSDAILAGQYAQAEALLAANNTLGAAIAFAQIHDQDAQEHSLALWNEYAARETIAAGLKHTLSLKSDGTVMATGNNPYGQCDVSSWSDIMAISAGNSHTVGLKSDGTVVAVGDNLNCTPSSRQRNKI